jgi:hypothetical protein
MLRVRILQWHAGPASGPATSEPKKPMPSKSASVLACLAATATISPLPALAAGPWYGVPLPDKTGLDADAVYAQRDFRDVSLRNRAEGDIVLGRVAGRSGDLLATACVRRQFEALGLTDVGVETVELAPQFWPVDVELTLIASAAAGAAAVIVILDLPIDVQTYNRALSGTEVPTIAIADYEGTFLENVMVRAGDEPVAARMRLRLEADDSSTSNVVGRVVGTSDEYAIVIAHRDANFYGAVDNGSGVAAMLGIAAHLARQAEPPRRTHLFVATGGHHVSGFPGSTGGLLVSDAEIPRYGSVVPRNQIVLDALSDSLAQHGVTMLANARDQAPGDVWPFQRRGFPVAQIIEVSNWYHTTADRLAVILPAGLERATRALAGFLQEIDSRPLRELGQQAPAVGR